jgi:Ni,Fe-hydrogenase I cytochrome b subunit
VHHWLTLYLSFGEGHKICVWVPVEFGFQTRVSLSIEHFQQRLCVIRMSCRGWWVSASNVTAHSSEDAAVQLCRAGCRPLLLWFMGLLVSSLLKRFVCTHHPGSIHAAVRMEQIRCLHLHMGCILWLSSRYDVFLHVIHENMAQGSKRVHKDAAHARHGLCL